MLSHARHARPKPLARVLAAPFAFLAGALIASLVSLSGPSIAATDVVTPPPTITFSTTAAGWTATGSSAGFEKGINPAPAALHVAHLATGCPYAPLCGYAQILINNVSRDAALTSAPVLQVTNYAAGTPRGEIVPEIGADSIANDVTIYPDGALCGQPASSDCYDLGTGGQHFTSSWTAAQAYLVGKGGIKSVYVVADESQAAPYTSLVTSLVWDGTSLLPQQVPDVLTAAYVCGTSYANRVWRVTNVNVGGHVVSFAYSIRLASGRILPVGSALVDAHSSVLVATHRGIGPLFVKWSSLGHAFSTRAYVPAHQIACS